MVPGSGRRPAFFLISISQIVAALTKVGASLSSACAYGGCFFACRKRGDVVDSRNQLQWGCDRASLDHRDYDFW
jgi:hypothetical protein